MQKKLGYITKLIGDSAHVYKLIGIGQKDGVLTYDCKPSTPTVITRKIYRLELNYPDSLEMVNSLITDKNDSEMLNAAMYIKRYKMLTSSQKSYLINKIIKAHTELTISKEIRYKDCNKHGHSVKSALMQLIRPIERRIK